MRYRVTGDHGTSVSNALSSFHPVPLRPAPGGLALVQRFVNTLDLEHGRDQLGPWLAAQGAPASAGELAHAREVREALRALIAGNGGAPVPPEALETLDGARPTLAVRFASGTPRLEPVEPGVRGFISGLLAAVEASVAEGTWLRLKVCRMDVCRWAFYDWSKNRSGQWCTMVLCGNRAKTRAYRSRRGEGSGKPEQILQES
jgi:predicted RNA-binding Zn ribbon-like protein